MDDKERLYSEQLYASGATGQGMTGVGKPCPQHACLELRKIAKRFPGTTAVNGVSLTIQKGEVFTLLGPSGCGKSTLLKIVAGLETQDEGDVFMDGQLVNDVPPYRRNCSMVFQNLALFPHMTVEQNIAFGLERRKVSKNEIRKRVGEMLDLVRLSGMEKRRPAQLSGGQQQRVAIARSLVLEPALLLLDEPLASLDRKLRKEMQVELKRIQREVNATFLYVTHDQKEALCLSDKIAVMRAGRLVQIATPDEIYGSPRTRFVADFMGASNIFSCAIVGVSEGRLVLETADGLRIVAVDEGKRHVGEKAEVAVRPEAVEVIPAKWGDALNEQRGPDNSYPGRVDEVVYQGDFTEVRVALAGTDTFVLAQIGNKPGRNARFQINEEVIVHWNPSDCMLLCLEEAG